MNDTAPDQTAPSQTAVNQTAYATLASHYQRIASLSNALGILHWDAESMMPDGGAPTRADSLATIEVVKRPKKRPGKRL